jgi:hypothetical protein
MAAIVNPKAKLKFIDRTVVLCIDGVVRDRAVIFSQESSRVSTLFSVKPYSPTFSRLLHWQRPVMGTREKTNPI